MSDPRMTEAVNFARWRHLAEACPVDGAPTLAEEALHGLAGEFVRLVEPHTESDPAALLFQFLAASGNAMGPAPHYLVEQTPHRVNLYVAVVGESAKARKGTSLRWVEKLVREIEPEWALRCSSGLSSGEGLIQAVRDSAEEGSEDPQPGVADKRLFVMESEFASVLKKMTRDGNTLSPILRDAWDTGSLQTLTRKDPLRATGAHISLVTHITREELRQLLTATDQANGLANRFLWVSARRSKYLPEGGSLDHSSLSSLSSRLRGVLGQAREAGRVTRSPEAAKLWKAVYPTLSDGVPGVLGKVTSRAEAQVTRLSVLYALLDGARVIQVEHLAAGLAAWRFALDSARHIFGDGLGSRLADRLRAVLGEAKEPLSRTDLFKLADSHAKAWELDLALELLEAAGIARKSTDASRGGRPSELWALVDPAKEAKKAKKAKKDEGRAA